MLEPNQENYAAATKSQDEEAQIALLAAFLRSELGDVVTTCNTGGNNFTLTISSANAIFEFGTASEVWSGAVCVNEEYKGAMRTDVMVSNPNSSEVYSAIIAAINRYEQSGQTDSAW